VQIKIKHLCWKEFYTLSSYISRVSFIILLTLNLATSKCDLGGLLGVVLLVQHLCKAETIEVF